MSEPASPGGLSRRELIKTGALAAGAAAVLPARPGWAQLKSVPRNRTLTLVWIGSREGRWVDYELWNRLVGQHREPEVERPAREAGS